MNVDVKTVTAADGRPAVLTAWCPTCRHHTMPNGHGECLWCDRRIVDEHALEEAA